MDPFARQAAQYALRRPTYPPALLGAMRARVDEACPLRTRRALDVACGSGQLTGELASWFEGVVGLDRSAAQLAHFAGGKASANVTFIQGEALDLPFADQTFDVVTIAQGLHWLDLDKALREFRRVLKPNGMFFALGYGICRLLGEEKAQREFAKYYVDVLGSTRPFGDAQCLWDCDRTRLDSAHAGESFVGPDRFSSCERERFPFVFPNITARSFLEYLETQSAYQKIADRNPLRDIRQALEEGGRSLDREVQVEFPFWLISCTRTETKTSAAAHL